MKFDRIFLKFGKLTSNYITKLSTYARHNYEIFENFGAMLINIFTVWNLYKERSRKKLLKDSKFRAVFVAKHEIYTLYSMVKRN